MDNSTKSIPDGFVEPTARPQSDEQRARWQAANRDWWERRPMRYDFGQAVADPEFSHRFYQEIDRRFFEVDAREYMPWKRLPFDQLIDYDAIASQDVLEIGVGNGSHAQLLAAHAKTFTGIDLTEYAVKSTSTRLAQELLPGRVLQMDAERMSFPDASFDFVWSWGVIHHSADTSAVLREIARVLRPGGRAVTMVYHRNFWNYYVMSGFFHGVVRGQLKGRSLHQVVQRQIDGALARYFTVPQWRALVSPHLAIDWTRIYGSKTELLPLPAGRVKNAIRHALPDPAGRLFTNTLGWGTFLCSGLRKR
jgi:ubiquinone/menaquinone biosynthesis C-methylase UbiE